MTISSIFTFSPSSSESSSGSSIPTLEKYLDESDNLEHYTYREDASVSEKFALLANDTSRLGLFFKRTPSQERMRKRVLVGDMNSRRYDAMCKIAFIVADKDMWLDFQKELKLNRVVTTAAVRAVSQTIIKKMPSIIHTPPSSSFNGISKSRESRLVIERKRAIERHVVTDTAHAVIDYLVPHHFLHHHGAKENTDANEHMKDISLSENTTKLIVDFADISTARSA